MMVTFTTLYRMTEPMVGANTLNIEQDLTLPAGKQPHKSMNGHTHPDHTLKTPQKPRHGTKATYSMAPAPLATRPDDDNDDTFMANGEHIPPLIPESPTIRVAWNFIIARASLTVVLSVTGFQLPTFTEECIKVPSQLTQSPHQCVPSSDGEDAEFISHIRELRVTLNSGWFCQFLSTPTWLMTGFSTTMCQAILDDSKNWVSLVPFNEGSTLFQEVPNIIDVIADLLFKLGIEVEDMSSAFVGQTMPTPSHNTCAGGRGARGNHGGHGNMLSTYHNSLLTYFLDRKLAMRR